jgi:hypothetical protein
MTELKVVKSKVKKEKKFVVVRRNIDNKKEYAAYFPTSCRAVLYMKAIAEWAKKTGSNFEHLVECIIYHEKAHYLHDINGVVFTKCRNGEVLNPQEERACDEYAIREFFKAHGFKPDINMEEWFK